MITLISWEGHFPRSLSLSSMIGVAVPLPRSAIPILLLFLSLCLPLDSVPSPRGPRPPPGPVRRLGRPALYIFGLSLWIIRHDFFPNSNEEPSQKVLRFFSISHPILTDRIALLGFHGRAPSFLDHYWALRLCCPLKSFSAQGRILALAPSDIWTSTPVSRRKSMTPNYPLPFFGFFPVFAQLWLRVPLFPSLGNRLRLAPVSTSYTVRRRSFLFFALQFDPELSGSNLRFPKGWYWPSWSLYFPPSPALQDPSRSLYLLSEERLLLPCCIPTSDALLALFFPLTKWSVF